MKNNPKYKYDISIIILNYNRVHFLDRSIRSCSDQILFNKSTEIIFIDDGSTDNSINYVKELKIPNLKIFSNSKNKGIGYSSKRAVNLCKGKYFIRVDSDDFLNSHALEMMSKILDANEELAFVNCDHFRVDERGLKQKKIKVNTFKTLKDHGAGILFRTDFVKKIGNYRSSLREGEDYDLISRLKKKFKFFYLPVPLYRYYIHDKNVSHSGNRKKYINKIKN